jgi:hypothetical protein
VCALFFSCCLFDEGNGIRQRKDGWMVERERQREREAERVFVFPSFVDCLMKEIVQDKERERESEEHPHTVSVCVCVSGCCCCCC